MKKIFNICVLLLSLIGCANNVTSSSTCPCENLIKENNIKYSIFDITGLTSDDIFRVATVFNPKYNTTYEIKEEDFNKFFDFVDREYMMTNIKYIDETFMQYKEEKIEWVMLENENYGIGINQVFYENGDSFLLIFDTNPYISDVITKEENNLFLSSVGY